MQCLLSYRSQFTGSEAYQRLSSYLPKMGYDTREATDNEIDVLLMTLMPKFFRELGISLD
ncbi:hypothetical protein HanXRQr2_Chr17g0790741 [Helianthus annuus]|uniref:Uncharacterized protein n=1 Tax=Helianthus annuus TaxID=4232 RepID=A0A251RMT7_HELAN|nr:hypothetical protein HanXRQr2_Chr17g0790741 [Helianthus annuus]